MPVASLDDINNSFPENRYMLKVIHEPNLWKKSSIPALPTPVRFKFDDTILTSIPSSIANDKGIYMFFLEPSHPFLPPINHLLYIGRVQAGNSNFSFRKRMYDYKRTIGDLIPEHNIVITSLGPKLTALSLYRLYIDFPEIALAYVPCREFNLDYSKGIGSSTKGVLDLS